MYSYPLTRLVFFTLFAALLAAACPVFAQTDGTIAEPEYLTQDGTVQTQQMAARSGVAAQDIAIRIQLQAILDVQAQYGQFPGNNRLLADIQSLINSGPNQTNTMVRVTNFGPGKLTIVKPGGAVTELEKDKSTTIEVGAAQVGLYSQFQYATIRLQHDRNAPCQFWDEDDRVHTDIGPGFDFDGNPIAHQFTLTPGVRGYHLEQ